MTVGKFAAKTMIPPHRFLFLSKLISRQLKLHSKQATFEWILKNPFDPCYIFWVPLHSLSIYKSEQTAPHSHPHSPLQSPSAHVLHCTEMTHAKEKKNVESESVVSISAPKITPPSSPLSPQST